MYRRVVRLPRTTSSSRVSVGGAFCWTRDEQRSTHRWKFGERVAGMPNTRETPTLPEGDAGDAQQYAAAEEAASSLQERGVAPPRVAIILGTGLGFVAEKVEDALVVPYAEIPHFPLSTVAGHAGRLVCGRLAGVSVAVMQGRFHLYEGYRAQQVVFPLRVLRLLGAETLIVTNAAGGLSPALPAGSLMAVADHIGLPTMGGTNPLVGPNEQRFGPRFPPMTGAYDVGLRRLARAVADDLSIALHSGVYAMVSGPNYETPAELRFLRLAGADAVGMSTVPEVIAARHLGMRVLAISCVTNETLPDAAAPAGANHLDVVAVAEAAGTRLAAIVEGVLARIDEA